VSMNALKKLVDLVHK